MSQLCEPDCDLNHHVGEECRPPVPGCPYPWRYVCRELAQCDRGEECGF